MPGRCRGVLIALAVLLLASACSSESRRRVLLVAVDGASNKVILPLIERGELPAFAALRREGVSGELRPGRPILSPRIWTTVATGKVPEPVLRTVMYSSPDSPLSRTPSRSQYPGTSAMLAVTIVNALPTRKLSTTPSLRGAVRPGATAPSPMPRRANAA